MARNWTDAQKAAIDIRGKTLLVSAAAGSGKTATLTERIIRRITNTSDPADISKMLIVTFTRAAATELRSRIFAALSDALAENPSSKHLASQLMKIGNAHISTIDSFYFELIQSNLSSLGLSNSIRIADDAEYAILSHRVMEEVVNDFYENFDTFPSFVECFAGTKQLNLLSDIFLNIHQKLSSIPEGIVFLKMCSANAEMKIDDDFFSTPYGEVLQKSTKELLEHFLPLLTEAVEFIARDENIYSKYGESFCYDLDICKKLYSSVQNHVSGYSDTRDILESYSPISLKALNKKYTSDELNRYKEHRAEFVKRIKALADKAFSKSPYVISTAMEDTSAKIYMLYVLLREFEKAIDEEKKRIGILTFSDIRRYTLELLVDPLGYPSDIAKQYSEQFDEIYIDEYQDVDRVQDLIFRSISKPNNRFMVGDIKQSIYEFRGAEPKLFAEYKTNFPAYSSAVAQISDNASIFMSNNFRCDENIIEFTNLVCSRIFYAVADSIGYTRDDDLKFSKEVPNNYVSPRVNVNLIQSPSKAKKEEAEGGEYDELGSNKEIEAEYIASEIERLLKSNTKKANGEPLRPCDIAVLFRSSTIAPYIAEALKKRGILSNQSDAKKYFENPDVLMMLCILNTVDNPERDTYLAGTLRSPIFDFSMEELITIRIAYDATYSLYEALCQYSKEKEDSLAKKCADFISLLEKWQYEAASLPVDRFLRVLFDHERFIASGMVSQIKDTGEGGNILLLYEYARKFENGSFKGLYQFLEYVTSMIENGKTFTMGNSNAATDRVSLMTIHKSKGLEFPVCFICDTNHSIRSKDTNESFVFDYPCGVALKLSESSGLARINTPMREAIVSRIATRQAEEEMRILYVALTRARERLYITAATSKDIGKMLDAALTRSSSFDRYTAINTCSSYLDWILAGCTKPNTCYAINVINCEDINAPTDNADSQEKESFTPDPELTERLKEKLSFEYPYKNLSRVPSKISVSRLYPDILDENDDTLELFTEVKKAAVPDFFIGTKGTKASSAERGTATHLFLQFCDFEYACKNGAKEELARLQQKRFLPPNAASLIYIEELDRFLESELIKKILSAKRIIREQRFNVELPPEGFTKNKDLIEKMHGETLAVQGVIDLILIGEDGSIELYDYKTDRLSAKELSSHAEALKEMNYKHGQQLYYYSKAIEALMGKKCSRVAVYSTHSAKLYDIDLSFFESKGANLI